MRRSARAGSRGASLSSFVWSGTGVVPSVARVALIPLAALYRTGTAVRNALFDAGVLTTHATSIPAISVGNLTVGGTGKTPVAAWIVRQLQQLGARPAIVLRGYGDDEPLVHARLNPDVPVEVNADRVAGISAAARRGATVAVLDDAFQHRRVARALDLVLVSADAARDTLFPLPAGPWRESPGALRRASMVLITRKVASDADVAKVRARVAAASPAVPIGVVALQPAALRSLHDAAERPLDDVDGKRVLAVSAIGNPAPFVAQLRAAGATVEPRTFPDHYAFSVSDTDRLVMEAAAADLVVCTLKDAVKLERYWPRAAVPAWYVSQRLHFEEGEDTIRRLLLAVHVHAAPIAFTGTSSASR